MSKNLIIRKPIKGTTIVGSSGSGMGIGSLMGDPQKFITDDMKSMIVVDHGESYSEEANQEIIELLKKDQKRN